MNKQRRNEIKNIMKSLEVISSSIDDILNDETDYYDNIPENLLSYDRAENSEEAIEYLENAIEKIDEAIDILDEIQ